MASRNHTFIRDEILPSYFVNVLQDRIGALSSLRLRQASATTVEVPAAAGDGAAVLSIEGRWRWRETTTNVGHPGGAPGTYLVFAVAAENDIVGSPQPNTDNTNYSFSLRIVADGNTPSLVPGVVDVVRRIGRLTWDGVAITSVAQEVGVVEGAALADGAVGDVKLAAALARVLGVSQPGGVRRGKCFVAAEESRASAAFGLLTTPDRVPSIELPVDGFIVVAYRAIWRHPASPNAGKAAIFLGANQLKGHVPGAAGPSVVQEAQTPATANVWKPVGTFHGGLTGYSGAQDFTGWGATGEALSVNAGGVGPDGDGGVCYIAADAGTYDVSVQFRATSGTVQVKERKLWVWTVGF